MNTWLVGFAVEISGVEMMVHHMALLQIVGGDKLIIPFC